MSDQPTDLTVIDREPVTMEVGRITPSQAKIDAVAALTMAAYQKAAMLSLTPEETAALQADFPDEAFRPGAAGKESLIYIEHAWLRDRLTSVLGMGQWAIVPRNRWEQPFRTHKGVDGSRIYVEAMLVIRGCFVGEAIGDMDYYPENQSTNYGDAVEGATTACLRRCCKALGVGLQAWKKEWCEGWWARRRPGSRGVSGHPPEPKSPAPSHQQAPSATSEATKDPLAAKHEFPPATPQSRMKALHTLRAAPGENNRGLVEQFLISKHWININQQPEDWPLEHVPRTQKQFEALREEIQQFETRMMAQPEAAE